MNDLGLKLRKARKDKNITAKNLGKELGLSEDMICKIERGERNINIKYREQLKKILDIDIFENTTYPPLLMANIDFFKNTLISYNLTKYELEYVKLSLKTYYCNDFHKKESLKDELSKMYGYGKPKGNIDMVVSTAKSFFNNMLSEKKLYNLKINELENIVNSLNSTELVNANVIPVYNASTFFPYVDNIYKNCSTGHYFLPNNLANDKYEYIALTVTEFILETKNPKYKPLDTVILRLGKELNNGSDILISNKNGMFIKNLKINNNIIILSNPSELNPNPKKYELKNFEALLSSFEINIVGTIVDICVDKNFAYDYLTQQYYFPFQLSNIEVANLNKNIESK